MVLMKNSANAFAPSGVCRVAATGMIGGRSPMLMLGPVVGTSAGRLGDGGPDGDGDGPECDAVDPDGATEVTAAPEATDAETEGEATPGADEVGEPLREEVQPTQESSVNAAIIQAPRTLG
jgi:hypothetical protein